MTRRILAGFLGVLVAVLAAVVVPLGVLLTMQQRDDFRDGTRTTARAVAALAEEQLDDQKHGALASPLSGLAANGDRVTVLNAAGTVIAQVGGPLPASALAALRSGNSGPDVPGAVVAVEPVGDPTRIGTVLLARDAGPLEHRQKVLWTWLATAAGAALLLGTGIGWMLSRWISRPLSSLATATHRIGSDRPLARADTDSGPPEVRQLATAFNTMAGRVASLLESQRSMTAEVSHQLRTPLAALRLRLELLGGDLDPDGRDEVLALLEETDRLSRLVEGLLAVARAESVQVTPEPTDIAAVARERLTAWQPVAEEQRIALRLDVAPAVAMTGPDHVDQILDNLVDNAIAAGSPGAEITISTRTENSNAVLSVADTGPGMSPDQRDRALNPYYTDRAGGGGTGLGLHVVARLARADDGVVSLRETPGGGLTVEVRFPSA